MPTLLEISRKNTYFVSSNSNTLYKSTLYLISKILYLKVSCNLYSRYLMRYFVHLCLWGYLKQHEYIKLINDIRITYVIHSFTPDGLNRVWQELKYRLDVCRPTNRSHIDLHWIGTKLEELSFHLVKISHFYCIFVWGWYGGMVIYI